MKTKLNRIFCSVLSRNSWHLPWMESHYCWKCSDQFNLANKRVSHNHLLLLARQWLKHISVVLCLTNWLACEYLPSRLFELNRQFHASLLPQTMFTFVLHSKSRGWYSIGHFPGRSIAISRIGNWPGHSITNSGHAIADNCLR